MSIQRLQRQVDEWIQDYGVRYFDPLTNMTLLMEEVGELARIFAREYGEQSYKSTPTQPLKQRLSDEMADVFFVLVCLANQCDIDLDEAMRRNLQKKMTRDEQRHRANPKLRRDD